MAEGVINKNNQFFRNDESIPEVDMVLVWDGGSECGSDTQKDNSLNEMKNLSVNNLNHFFSPIYKLSFKEELVSLLSTISLAGDVGQKQ